MKLAKCDQSQLWQNNVPCSRLCPKAAPSGHKLFLTLILNRFKVNLDTGATLLLVLCKERVRLLRSSSLALARYTRVFRHLLIRLIGLGVTNVT